MPREAFNNLKPKKQKKIFAVAKTIFTENAYEDVSISQVISKVGISRGSFYLYFENKLDLYLYVLSSNRKSLVENFVKNILIGKTIFETFNGLFEELISYIEKEDPKFIERAIMNLNPQIILYFIDGLKENKNGNLDFSLFSDYDKLKPENQKGIITIIEVLATLTITEYCFVLLNRHTIEESRINLARKFSFIKNSVYK